MSKYRVLMSRTKNIIEHAVVIVEANTEEVAKQKAQLEGKRGAFWEEDYTEISPIEFDNIRLIYSPFMHVYGKTEENSSDSQENGHEPVSTDDEIPF